MRLTEKLPNGIYHFKRISRDCDILYNFLQKLGKLEDIEEELGIDLFTLFKALKQGHIWVKKQNEVISSCEYDLGLTGTTYDLYCKDVGEWLLVKEYGKTWSLDRRELE